ncbi:MAG: hypothetical protein HRU26_05615 [Psychroserpens sp.]|nr:hypothetical protein [Psychroserpens sp.]
MAYLIDTTYFQRELFVPNADEQDSRTYKELETSIDGYVRDYLRQNLGYALFNNLDGQIVNGNLPSTADQKWLNLVNGAEYTKDGKTYYWLGLLHEDGKFKKSLLANYVFVNWLENNVSTQSGVGEVVIDAKNSTRVSVNNRLIKVWNDFVEMHQGEESIYDVPYQYYYDGVLVTDWLANSQDDNYVSLVQFLSDNDTDYPDVPCKLYELKNSLGL